MEKTSIKSFLVSIVGIAIIGASCAGDVQQSPSTSANVNAKGSVQAVIDEAVSQAPRKLTDYVREAQEAWTPTSGTKLVRVPQAKGVKQRALLAKNPAAIETNATQYVRVRQARMSPKRLGCEKWMRDTLDKVVAHTRYEERSKTWKEKFGADVSATNRQEFWGFVVGSTYSETFPGQPVLLSDQAQGLALVGRHLNLKEKILGFSSACVSFTPCSLLLDNINYYWNPGEGRTVSELNELISSARDKVIADYGFEVDKVEKDKSGTLDVRMKKGDVMCTVFYCRSLIYLVVWNERLQLCGDKEKKFLGVVGIF